MKSKKREIEIIDNKNIDVYYLAWVFRIKSFPGCEYNIII